jgi:hypothetical protein
MHMEWERELRQYQAIPDAHDGRPQVEREQLPPLTQYPGSSLLAGLPGHNEDDGEIAKMTHGTTPSPVLRWRRLFLFSLHPFRLSTTHHRPFQTTITANTSTTSARPAGVGPGGQSYPFVFFVVYFQPPRVPVPPATAAAVSDSPLGAAYIT